MVNLRPFVCLLVVSVTLVSCAVDSSPLLSPSCPPKNVSGRPVIFNVTDDEGSVCIVFKSSVKVQLTYQTINGTNHSQTWDLSLFNPTVNHNNSRCGASYQSLSIDFGSETGLTRSELTFSFSDRSNKTDKGDGTAFALYKIEGNFDFSDPCLFPDANSTGRMSGHSADLKMYTVGVNHSYSCTPDVTTKLTGAPVSVTLGGVQFEAFGHSLADDKLDPAHFCPQQDETNDLVPIIVGAALAGLVVVVLIAYLVGRVRQKQSTGYESV